MVNTSPSSDRPDGEPSATPSANRRTIVNPSLPPQCVPAVPSSHCGLIVVTSAPNPKAPIGNRTTSDSPPAALCFDLSSPTQTLCQDAHRSRHRTSEGPSDNRARRRFCQFPISLRPVHGGRVSRASFAALENQHTCAEIELEISGFERAWLDIRRSTLLDSRNKDGAARFASAEARRFRLYRNHIEAIQNTGRAAKSSKKSDPPFGDPLGQPPESPATTCRSR